MSQDFRLTRFVVSRGCPQSSHILALFGVLWACGNPPSGSTGTGPLTATEGDASVASEVGPSDASGPENGRSDAGLTVAPPDAGDEPCAQDADEDGVCDTEDVCPRVADDQLDSDQDGVGDACECADVTCAEGDQCQAPALCEPTTGECVYVPLENGTSCDDGDLCSSGDSCQQGVCTAAAVVLCNALDQCHTAGTCDPQTGVCSQPIAPDDTGCDDGDLCSTADSCRSGVCTAGAPVECTALDQCHSAGVCNPQTGACSQPPVADDTGCNDGDLCSVADSCQSGICRAGNPVTCSAQDQCHTVGICNPQTGTCSQPTAADGVTCDDASVCTTLDSCQQGVCTGGSTVACNTPGQCERGGTCDAVRGCEYTPAANGSLCTDGDICTSSDSCQSGVCSGTTGGTCSSSQIVVTWDPAPAVNYTNPSRLDPNVPSSFATVGNIELESWAVEDYGRAGLARYFDSHDHVSNNCPAGTDCGNNSLAENQHAFESMLQGFVVSLVGGGNFDLVSLDYRIRDDSQVNTDGERPHVSTIPGVDTSRVELWLGTEVDISVPASEPFATLDLGAASPQMGQFRTLAVGDFQNVSQIFITSTGNVSFDNIVIVPR